jgi:hypothetical protein
MTNATLTTERETLPSKLADQIVELYKADAFGDVHDSFLLAWHEVAQRNGMYADSDVMREAGRMAWVEVG